MEKIFLDGVDEALYAFLNSHADRMPTRFGKMIALYYPDARIRKKYSGYIGLEMGKGTYANLGLKVVPNNHEICVHIGRKVSIAPDVVFVCASAPNNGEEIKKIPHILNRCIRQGDIYVEDEVWIGARVVIFPGVTIGRCSVIGAGSVVRQNVEPYSVYAGVPAKKVRELRNCN